LASLFSDKLKETSDIGGGGYAPNDYPKLIYYSSIIIAFWTYFSISFCINAAAFPYSAGSKILMASKFNAHTLLINTFFKFSYIICLFLFNID